ncbi:unnamed protein product [Danaus chrysippus]|uniref:(African queen) hypothetical protein n=1 Tax=Danaus chrysippus TaxID=151541 RepID=A0A8J2QWP3_9NEOP|nr:unnamed protein product [Danaus chrysippus]
MYRVWGQRWSGSRCRSDRPRSDTRGLRDQRGSQTIDAIASSLCLCVCAQWPALRARLTTNVRQSPVQQLTVNLEDNLLRMNHAKHADTLYTVSRPERGPRPAAVHTKPRETDPANDRNI